jgi:hypothetical protein
MSGTWSQLRARATAAAVAAPSDAAALAADMAARPQDYEIPAFALRIGEGLAWLRSTDKNIVRIKRRIATLLALVGGTAIVLRTWKLHRARVAKAAALAQRARDAAASSGPVLALSPSPDSAAVADNDDDKPSLGDRLLHIPGEDGRVLPSSSSTEDAKKKGGDKKAADSSDKPVKKHRVAVDALFFARLRHILRITVPGIYSTEALYIGVLTLLLFARTGFSIVIAELVGENAQSLVARRWGRMWRGIKMFALITIPASGVNGQA